MNSACDEQSGTNSPSTNRPVTNSPQTLQLYEQWKKIDQLLSTSTSLTESHERFS